MTRAETTTILAQIRSATSYWTLLGLAGYWAAHAVWLSPETRAELADALDAARRREVIRLYDLRAVGM